MALKEFNEFLEEPLVLPIRGKKYTVPPLAAEAGVKLSELFRQSAAGETSEELETSTEADLMRLALGPLWDELVESPEVTLQALYLAGRTALVDFSRGREAAELYWNAGGSPGEAKAAPKAPQDRKTKKTSTGTGAASTTKRRASTSGTKSRKAPSSK